MDLHEDNPMPRLQVGAPLGLKSAFLGVAENKGACNFEHGPTKLGITSCKRRGSDSDLT